MIKVNWQKIKPYEDRVFAVPVTALLIVLAVVAIVIGFFSKFTLLPLKYLTAIFIFLTAAFNIKIESRMLQIYLLLGVLDIGLVCAGLVPVAPGLTILLFIISLLSLIASAALCISAHFLMNKDTAYNCPEPDRSNVYAGKNVMFFAPHEDDEINIYGGIIEQYVKNGSTVRVVFSTNGDYHGIGKIRIREARNVAKKYNIPFENFIFFGYSDSLADENGVHIYNCPADKNVYSRYKVSKTYGTKNKPPYSEKAFTRQNVVDDFKSVILEYKPDTIFCCDYDVHSDHRAISLFFEDAMSEILRETAYYNPVVYKGFAYSTAWNGKEDYYSVNARSTHLKEDADYMAETGFYAWKDRVRFPVAVENLSRVMQNSSSYIAMAEYSSQTATDHANGILNGDKVFWKRRTDSVLYNAEISASSGDASHLTEFKIAHSNDIMDKDRLPNDNAWVADSADEHKMLMFKLPSRRRISSIYIYENPDRGSHIVNAFVTLGARSFSTGELKENGGATIFEFPGVETDVIGIAVKSYTGYCSLLKIEAFEEPESSLPQLIKLCNNYDDFCYDYIVSPSGKEDFDVYTYPQANADFKVMSSNNAVKAECIGGKISIFCPPEEESIIRVELADNPLIYDEIRVSNPDDRVKEVWKLKQRYEHRIMSPAMQWDYYRGLLRRLLAYFPYKEK